MSQEDVFSGAMAATVFLTAYMNTVAEEIGEDKAISLGTKMCETMGAVQGQMLKEQAGDIEIGAKAAYEILANVYNGLGISSEVIEENPQAVIAKTSRCPVYEAAKMLGMDEKTIEDRCRKVNLAFGNTMVSQLNPGLSVELKKFRSSADDFCEEAVVQT